MIVEKMLVESLQKAVKTCEAKSGERVYCVYLTRSRIWSTRFGLYLQTSGLGTVIPYTSFQTLHHIFKEQLGNDMFSLLDDFIAIGYNNKFIVKNNTITKPNTNNSYPICWQLVNNISSEILYVNK